MYNIMLLGIRVLLFGLSTFGYLAFLHTHTRLKIEFLPAVTFSGQICILFLGGILNLLPILGGLIFLTGLALAVLSLKNRESLRDFLCPGYFFFLLSSLYFLILLKGQVFTSYDNFSHWALVVKQMLLTDRFPTWQDPIILFQSYPLGSSVFVYYVSKIISTVSEGCQMFAQTMLTLSMILPLFSLVRKNKWINSLLIAAAAVFLLSFNNWPTELLVDTLLPLTGAAGFFLAGEELSAEKRTVWFSVPLAVSMILIKNSGIFFWALTAARVVIHWISSRKTAGRQEKLSWCCLILLPLTALLLWKKHVEYVFYSGMTSVHSMSLKAYAANIQEKSGEAVSQILHAFIQQLVSGRLLLYLLGITLLCAVLCRVWKQESRSWGKTALLITAVYLGYQAGNLCMYLFSMPVGEAVVMSGYSRYYRTIIAWCLICVLCQVIRWLDQQKLSVSLSLLLLFILCFWQMGANPHILRRSPAGGTRAQLDQIIEAYSVEPSSACIVYIPQDDMWYTYHLTKFLLYTPTVDVHISADREELETALNTAKDLGYDYFINLDSDNEMIQDYCREAYGVSADTPLVRLQ